MAPRGRVSLCASRTSLRVTWVLPTSPQGGVLGPVKPVGVFWAYLHHCTRFYPVSLPVVTLRGGAWRGPRAIRRSRRGFCRGQRIGAGSRNYRCSGFVIGVLGVETGPSRRLCEREERRLRAHSDASSSRHVVPLARDCAQSLDAKEIHHGLQLLHGVQVGKGLATIGAKPRRDAVQNQPRAGRRFDLHAVRAVKPTRIFPSTCAAVYLLDGLLSSVMGGCVVCSFPRRSRSNIGSGTTASASP